MSVTTPGPAVPRLRVRRPAAPRRSEAALQEQLVATLTGLGYTCTEIGKSRKRVKCPTCAASFFPRGWQGNTVGAPDVLVQHSAWPVGVAICLELKTATGKVRPEQAEALARGSTILVRDLQKPVGELLWYENLLASICIIGFDATGAKARADRLKRFLTMNEGRLQ